MSKLFSGSICLSELIEQAKKGHSAFTKSAKNGKVYANVLVWENDELDKYDNTHSFQLNSTKEKKDAEGKVYFGNVKPIEAKLPGKSDLPSEDWDANIPVKEGKKNDEETKDPKDDLPF